MVNYLCFICLFIGQDEVYNADKNWPKIHNTPWEVVEIKWKDSHNIRTLDIEKAKDTTFLTNEWPLYKNTNGFRLVSFSITNV